MTSIVYYEWLAISLLIAACGRTELSSNARDTGAFKKDDGGTANVNYKIAYVASDPVTPLRVWHSRTGVLDALPWTNTLHLAFTYNGKSLVALGIGPNPDYACTIAVEDARGNVLRRQTVPIPHGHPQCSEITPRGPDASRVLVAGTWQDSFDAGQISTAFYAILDIDGTYREFDGPILANFHYAPDNKALVFFDDDAHRVETMLDDGSDRQDLFIGGMASFSFDQQQLVFVTAGDAGFSLDLNVFDLTSRAVRVLGVQPWGALPQPQFTPDGKWIVFIEQAHSQSNPPVYSLRRLSLITGTVETILEDTGAHGYLPPTFSVAEDHDG